MTNLKPLAIAIVALASLPAISVAEDTQPVVAPIESEQAVKSCAEALRDAEFIRELQRDEGNANPALPPVPECASGNYNA